jgi:hypothetical protein
LIESQKYPENIIVSKTPNGRYSIAYDGVKLEYSLASLRNVDKFIIMTQQALIQYDSCRAQRGLLDAFDLISMIVNFQQEILSHLE